VFGDGSHPLRPGVDIFGCILFLLEPKETALRVREERKRTKRPKPSKKSQFTGENKQRHQQLVALD
jgi:hypothetical protein